MREDSLRLRLSCGLSVAYGYVISLCSRKQNIGWRRDDEDLRGRQWARRPSWTNVREEYIIKDEQWWFRARECERSVWSTGSVVVTGKPRRCAARHTHIWKSSCLCSVRFNAHIHPRGYPVKHNLLATLAASQCGVLVIFITASTAGSWYHFTDGWSGSPFLPGSLSNHSFLRFSLTCTMLSRSVVFIEVSNFPTFFFFNISDHIFKGFTRYGFWTQELLWCF